MTSDKGNLNEMNNFVSTWPNTMNYCVAQDIDEESVLADGVRPTLQYYDKSITCMDTTYDYERTFEFEPELEQLNLTLKRWLQRDLDSMP